ncbi:MAG TPA: ribosome-associated translation inhibitor RaiA [Saprospiraceae bacterium]|nr:ribosome-associated translation inhibitor RaiA [Saprospiraceae bacterium]
MKTTIESHHFTADSKLTDFIEQKMEKLEKYSDQIQSSDVKLKLENTGQIKDKVVEVIMHIPGTTLFAKETDKTFETAVDQCVDALKRQIIKYKERLRAH